jgi:inner membrane protein
VDNVTHTLTGLMLSRSGIDRKVARAAPMMMIAANLPDIDAVAFFGGPVVYLQWHRSYPHALVFAPLMALIPPLLFLIFARQRITLWAYAGSLIGVLSHLALDWTNVYGIRLLLPFSDRYFRLDITEIVDPWILAILFLALAAPALARMVGSEIASRRVKSGPHRGWAWFALIALFSYEAVRYTAHERALAVMGAHTFNGVIPSRLTALPRGANPLLWKGVAEGVSVENTGDQPPQGTDREKTAENPQNGRQNTAKNPQNDRQNTVRSDRFVTIVPVDLSEAFDPTAGRVDYDAPPSPAIDAARATHPFQVFAQFDQLPFWKVTRTPTETVVELIDLRFGTPQHPGFEASATVDESGGVHNAHARFGR